MGTKRVDVRLETDQWDQIEKFRLVNRVETPSEVIRMLIDVALRDSTSLEESWLKTTIAEGYRKGRKKFFDRLDDVEKATGV